MPEVVPYTLRQVFIRHWCGLWTCIFTTAGFNIRRCVFCAFYLYPYFLENNIHNLPVKYNTYLISNVQRAGKLTGQPVHKTGYSVN